MLDITYVHRENFLLDFWKYWKLIFEEATASECFDHFFNLQRGGWYLAEFLSGFIKKYWDEQFPIDIETIWVEVLYEKIRDSYFKDFFNSDQKNKWGETPFYSLLAWLWEIVWDPYQFMEKRTWRQCIALIKGSVWNARSSTKEWQKENREMLRKDKWNTLKDKDMDKDVRSAIDLYKKQKQDATKSTWS